MPETHTTKAASTQGAYSMRSELVTVATLRELLKVQERMLKFIRLTVTQRRRTARFRHRPSRRNQR